MAVKLNVLYVDVGDGRIWPSSTTRLSKMEAISRRLRAGQGTAAEPATKLSALMHLEMLATVVVAVET